MICSRAVGFLVCKGQERKQGDKRAEDYKGNSQHSLGGAGGVRKSIEKTSRNVKNRAVVLWEYSYNEWGNLQVLGR